MLSKGVEARGPRKMNLNDETDWPPEDLEEVLRQKGQGKSKSPEMRLYGLCILSRSVEVQSLINICKIMKF